VYHGVLRFLSDTLPHWQGTKPIKTLLEISRPRLLYCKY